MKSNKIYKNTNKYLKKLYNSSIPNTFSFNQINIYSITYFILSTFSVAYFLNGIYKEHFLVYLSISIGSYIGSISIIKNGFKKLPIILGVTFIFSIISYYLNLKYFIVLLLVLSYPIYLLYKYKKLKDLSHFYFYNDNGFKGCNLLIKEIVPIKEYDNLIKINIATKENLTDKELKEFNNNLLLFCDKNKDLFLGFSYQIFKKDFKVYLYSNKEDISKLDKYLSLNINYEYEIEVSKDKDYLFYFNSIIPSNKLFLRMCNKNIIDNKLPDNINLLEEQNLILILSFSNKDKAMECKLKLEESKEYNKISYENNSDYVIKNKLKDCYNHILYIEKKSKIGLSKINMITDIMCDYAEEYNGLFEEWGIGTIED